MEMDPIGTHSLVEHFRKQAEAHSRGTHSFSKHVNRQTGKKGDSIIMIGSSGNPTTAKSLTTSVPTHTTPTGSVTQSVEQAETIIKHLKDDSRQPPITSPTVDGLSNFADTAVSVKRGRVSDKERTHKKAKKVKKQKTNYRDIFS